MHFKIRNFEKLLLEAKTFFQDVAKLETWKWQVSDTMIIRPYIWNSHKFFAIRQNPLVPIGCQNHRLIQQSIRRQLLLKYLYFACEEISQQKTILNSKPNVKWFNKNVDNFIG